MHLELFCSAVAPPCARDTLCRPSMLIALRYYWVIAKGHRLRPWKSPYIRWRLETFFGHEADDLEPIQFIGLMWRERARLERFLKWVGERKSARPS
jgi:hypothetical protein